MIGSNGILGYFLLLQQKCQLWNLYDDKVDIWDGRFLKGYESPSKYKKNAGKQIKERGVYLHDNKYHGVGYLESRVINYRFRLPKFYFVINPRYNDNQTFLETLYSMIENEIPLAKIFLADGGPKSKKVKEEVAFFRSVPIFSGPKNASGNILVTEKNRNFYADYIPEEYWNIIDKIYDIRTNVEQSFGYDFKTYDIENLERMGYESVSQYVGIINCLTLLNAIAAVITGQVALITKPKAFREFSLAESGKTLAEVELTRIPPKAEKRVIVKSSY